MEIDLELIVASSSTPNVVLLQKEIEHREGFVRCVGPLDICVWRVILALIATCVRFHSLAFV